MSGAGLLAAALLLDGIMGDPDALWRRVPHPVVLMGRAIALAERWLNRGRLRRLKGSAAVALLTGAAIALGGAIEQMPGGAVLSVLLAAILLAQRALSLHVRAVAEALGQGLGPARRAVGRIVGRDTGRLDDAAVARAAIESAAENFSDGVVAPAFWFALFGLPGILLCKMVNTADSMIGYRTERYRQFGWAAARLDDLVNWIPARISALLILLAGRKWPALSALRRDAGLHRSPNAGWPEAAMARVLGVALAGPRSYEGGWQDFPWVHPEGRRDAGRADILAADALLWRAWIALVLLGLLALGLHMVA